MKSLIKFTTYNEFETCLPNLVGRSCTVLILYSAIFKLCLTGFQATFPIFLTSYAVLSPNPPKMRQKSNSRIPDYCLKSRKKSQVFNMLAKEMQTSGLSGI